MQKTFFAVAFGVAAPVAGSAVAATPLTELMPVDCADAVLEASSYPPGALPFFGTRYG
ncbi:MAG: hypothetical protein JWP25_2754 [Bradyrhizobium sp.]|nr:hypothetical protein [Bradyrhizobium sp.]